MRITLIVLYTLALPAVSFSQKGMTFNEAEKSGIDISLLDSLYKSGIHSDTSLAVFKANADEFVGEYLNLIKDLNKYLKESKFIWSKPTRMFNRVYFNKTGRIDYFLYNFQPGELSKKEEKSFNALLNKFITDYQFPLKAETNFAQCSPVKYLPQVN